MPEWSKGVDLRSTVFARVGSNPTFGRLGARYGSTVWEHGMGARYGSTDNGEHGIARLAQLVEHRSYEPKVTGSSPVSSIC